VYNNIRLRKSSRHSHHSTLFHRTPRRRRNSTSPRDRLPPIHTNRPNPQHMMRNSNSLQHTTLTINQFSLCPRRNSHRAAERRSRRNSAGASRRRRAGGEGRCFVREGGGEGAADLENCWLVLDCGPGGGVREGVYDVAVWAGGRCAERAGVAVCVGCCCEAGWWEAALCFFGDDVCAS
jgi:hypothetical protein